jgi:hypothetical protein
MRFMTYSLLAIVSLATLTTATAARAEEPAPPRASARAGTFSVELMPEGGLTLAGGQGSAHGGLAGAVSYRLAAPISLALVGAYGLGPGGSADANVAPGPVSGSVSAGTFRYARGGGEARFHPLITQSFDLWLGGDLALASVRRPLDDRAFIGPYLGAA